MADGADAACWLLLLGAIGCALWRGQASRRGRVRGRTGAWRKFCSEDSSTPEWDLDGAGTALVEAGRTFEQLQGHQAAGASMAKAGEWLREASVRLEESWEDTTWALDDAHQALVESAFHCAAPAAPGLNAASEGLRDAAAIQGCLSIGPDAAGPSIQAAGAGLALAAAELIQDSSEREDGHNGITNASLLSCARSLALAAEHLGGDASFLDGPGASSSASRKHQRKCTPPHTCTQPRDRARQGTACTRIRTRTHTSIKPKYAPPAGVPHGPAAPASHLVRATSSPCGPPATVRPGKGPATAGRGGTGGAYAVLPGYRSPTGTEDHSGRQLHDRPRAWGRRELFQHAARSTAAAGTVGTTLFAPVVAAAKDSGPSSSSQSKRSHLSDTLLQSSKPYVVQPDTFGSPSMLRPTALPVAAGDALDSVLRPNTRAVFLGEHHNSTQDHDLQAAIIQAIRSRQLSEHKAGPNVPLPPMAVGLEAVQRQFQPVLDAYVAGRLTESQLMERTEWSKRWSWPFDRYLPVFRAAKQLGLRLVALNVDSETLSKVEMGGFQGLTRAELSDVIRDGKGFASFSATTAFKEYVDYVVEPSYRMHQQMGILRTTVSGQRLEEDMSLKTFYSGRILWDEGMADVAARWCKDNSAGTLIALIGSDHVKFGCGVPGRTRRMLMTAGRDAPADKGSGGATVVRTVLLNPTDVDTNRFTEMRAPRSDQPLTLQLRFADTLKRADTGGQAPLSPEVVAAAEMGQTDEEVAVLKLADVLWYSPSASKA